MNYFERLVRRAVQQPAPRAGAAFFNPFEEIAEWPLDTPVPAEPPPAPLVASPEVTAIAAPAETSRAPADTTISRSDPAPASEVRPAPPQLAMPTAAATRDSEDAAAVEPPDPALQVITPQSPTPSPLARADEFLRGLGVRVPSPPSAPTVMPDVMPVAPPAIVVVSRAPSLHDAAPVPVTPPRPLPAPLARPARAAAEPEPRRAPTRRGETEPSPPSRTTPQIPDAVVVERRRGTVGSTSSARVGVGSPHVGLGQL